MEISFWWFSQGYVAMAFDPIGQGERLEYLGRNIGREQQLTKMIELYQNLMMIMSYIRISVIRRG